MLVRELAGDDEPIFTELPNHVQKVSDQTTTEPYVPMEDLPIGDAAILMAADGYGEGLVQGRLNGEELVTIKTSETNMNFTAMKDADPVELYDTACVFYDRIQRDRHMEH
jgi:hypothetical protein